METAWIAFAGVVIGTIISIVGGIITARLTMRSQIKTAALNAFLTARLKAYRDYESSKEEIDLKILEEKQAVLTVSMHYDLLTYPVPSPATPKSPRILRALSNRLRFSHCKTTDGTDIE